MSANQRWNNCPSNESHNLKIHGGFQKLQTSKVFAMKWFSKANRVTFPTPLYFQFSQLLTEKVLLLKFLLLLAILRNIEKLVILLFCNFTKNREIQSSHRLFYISTFQKVGFAIILSRSIKNKVKSYLSFSLILLCFFVQMVQISFGIEDFNKHDFGETFWS